MWNPLLVMRVGRKRPSSTAIAILDESPPTRRTSDRTRSTMRSACSAARPHRPGSGDRPRQARGAYSGRRNRLPASVHDSSTRDAPPRSATKPAAFASRLSTWWRRSASKVDGRFGEPHSSSPWCESIACSSRMRRTGVDLEARAGDRRRAPAARRERRARAAGPRRCTRWRCRRSVHRTCRCRAAAPRTAAGRASACAYCSARVRHMPATATVCSMRPLVCA